jgi:hypothetical protein
MFAKTLVTANGSSSSGYTGWRLFGKRFRARKKAGGGSR